MKSLRLVDFRWRVELRRVGAGVLSTIAAKA